MGKLSELFGVEESCPCRLSMLSAFDYAHESIHEWNLVHSSRSIFMS